MLYLFIDERVHGRDIRHALVAPIFDNLKNQLKVDIVPGGLLLLLLLFIHSSSGVILSLFQ